MPSPNVNRRAESFVIPPIDFVLVDAGEVDTETPLPANCRGILVGVAGFLNVVMQNGQERTALPFIEGLTPGFFATIKVSTGAGAAQNVWAVV